MNRRQRRAAGQSPPEFIALAAAYQCPDCSSETAAPVHVYGRLWRIEVSHDETCPTYRRLTEGTEF